MQTFDNVSDEGRLNAGLSVLRRQYKALVQYLEEYAEPEVRALYGFFDDQSVYEECLVVPAFDEKADFVFQHLSCFAPASLGAYILVINYPENAGTEAIRNTIQLRDSLLEHFNFELLGDALFVTRLESVDFYIFDFCETPFSAKQGVGKARKLGMDLALAFYALGLINGSERNIRWIRNTDADAKLPKDYFISCERLQGCTQGDSVVAFTYAYEHDAACGFENAMELYDLYLRYYEEMLQFAGSPYAYTCLGSLISVCPLAYANVRGMPKRSGAEDFYFLNKVAKEGRVLVIDSPKITLSGRLSQRVPFGTGLSVEKISKMGSAISEYRFQHPSIFEGLGSLLGLVDQFETKYSVFEFKRAFDFFGENLESWVFKQIKDQGLEKFLLHCQKQTTPTSFKADFHRWFDASATLKFLNAFSDRFSNPSLKELSASGFTLPSALKREIERVFETLSGTNGN